MRVLCLHGSGSTGCDFDERLVPLKDAVGEGWEFVTMDAPSGSGKWWTYRYARSQISSKKAVSYIYIYSSACADVSDGHAMVTCDDASTAKENARTP